VIRVEVVLATNESEVKQQAETASHIVYLQIIILTCGSIQYKVIFDVVLDLKTFERNK